ncbi:MAG: HVO_2072 family ArtA-dependent S-layer glycoprotein [Haloferacaceae archaeon]
MSDRLLRAAAVVLAVVTVLSVVVAPLGFAGPAAAAATNVSITKATNVVVDQSSARQTVAFDVTVANNSTDTVTVDTSAFRGQGATVTGASATLDGGTDVQVGSASLDGSSNVEFTVEDTGTNNASDTATVVVDVTYDTSGASTATGLSVQVSTAGGPAASRPADLVPPLDGPGSAADVTAESGQSQTVSGVPVNTGGNSNAVVYVDVSALEDAGGAVNGVSASASPGSVGAVGTQTVGGSTVVYARITGAGSGGPTTVQTTVDVTLQVNASGVAPGTSLSYPVGATVGSRNTSFVPDGSTATSFTVTRPAGVTRAGPGGSGSFDTAEGAGVVYPGAVVYRGEDDLEFGDPLSDTLTSVSEGTPLSPPIPPNVDTGRYSNDGTRSTPAITVDRPRISDFEIQNANGADVKGGAVTQSRANLTLVADYNFHRAENLEVTVREGGDDGLEVTNSIVDDAQANGGGSVRIPMDFRNVDAGTYNVTLEGSDSLTFDDASRATSIEVTSQEGVGVEMANDTVTQGANVNFDVIGGAAGDYHLLQIGSGDVRSGASPTNAATIFRPVGDVVEQGVVDGNSYVREANVNASTDVDGVYAVVEIGDDGLGRGSLDTGALAETSVQLTVSDPLAVSGGSYARPPTVAGNGDLESDDAEFDVEEGEVTLSRPGNTYVVGQSVTVNGTAPTGIESVAIYARQDDYEIVELDGDREIFVDADGTFEAEDIRLSEGNGGGNGVLALPGSYRIGVISAADADLDGDGQPDDRLTTQEFTQGTSEQQSIRVTGQSLSASFPSLVRGQIAEEDGDVNINGTAAGSDEVLFVAVGPRGNVVARSIGVDDDGSIDEDSVSISALSSGEVSLFVYSTGRDGRVGDGNLPGSFDATIDGLQEYAQQSLGEQSLTGDQVRSAFRSETVDATASDDLLESQQARLTGAQTRVTDVYPRDSAATGVNPVAVGDTVIVEGETNLQPEDNTITVELANEDTTVGLTSTELWGQDGVWVVEIDTEGAAVGTYTLTAEDGANTYTVDVQLVETLATPTPTPTEADTPTPSPTPTASPTPSPTPTASPTPSPTPTPTDGFGSGFGAVVAVLALLAAALIATRRR